MSYMPREVSDHISPLVIIVSKKEVLERNIQPALHVLRSLTVLPEISKAYKENVEITFQGYRDNISELFKSKPVREYVNLLDDEFPFWFFFLSKECRGLQNMVHCYIPPFLTDKGKREVFPERIGYYLTHRWLPAMTHLGQFAGCSEEEISELADRGVRYIESGRFNNCGYH
ncbi:MAG: hypothetical protein WCJ01_11415 [Ignavibacteria bacterium]